MIITNQKELKLKWNIIHPTMALLVFGPEYFDDKMIVHMDYLVVGIWKVKIYNLLRWHQLLQSFLFLQFPNIV